MEEKYIKRGQESMEGFYFFGTLTLGLLTGVGLIYWGIKTVLKTLSKFNG